MAREEMRYARVDAPRQVSIRSAPAVKPRAGEIRVRTLLSSISVGTELAVYRGTINTLKNPRWGYWTEFPIRPGYELVGVVEECGEQLRDVAVGDRVVCHAPHGTQAIVGYQDYVRVPDELSNEEASMAMLGATTAHGIRRADLCYGDRVLVLGYGAVGLLSADHARRAGARSVYVADPDQRRISLASERGFHASLDPHSPTFEADAAEVSEGAGMDVVIEASGHPGAIDEALAAVRRGGKILLQGTITAAVEVSFSDYPMHKEVTFISTWGQGPTDEAGRWGSAWTRKRNQELAMELIARGELRVRDLPRTRFPFARLAAVYDALDRGEIEALQVVLDY